LRHVDEAAVAQVLVLLVDCRKDFGCEALIRIVVRGEPVAVVGVFPLSPGDPGPLRVRLVGPGEEDPFAGLGVVRNPQFQWLAGFAGLRKTDRQGFIVEFPLQVVAGVVDDVANVQVTGIQRDFGESVIDRRQAMGDGPGHRALAVVDRDLQPDVLDEERPVPGRVLGCIRRSEEFRPIGETHTPARFGKFAHRKPPA